MRVENSVEKEDERERERERGNPRGMTLSGTHRVLGSIKIVGGLKLFFLDVKE